MFTNICWQYLLIILNNFCYRQIIYELSAVGTISVLTVVNFEPYMNISMWAYARTHSHCHCFFLLLCASTNVLTGLDKDATRKTTKNGSRTHNRRPATKSNFPQHKKATFIKALHAVLFLCMEIAAAPN